MYNFPTLSSPHLLTRFFFSSLCQQNILKKQFSRENTVLTELNLRRTELYYMPDIFIDLYNTLVILQYHYLNNCCNNLMLLLLWIWIITIHEKCISWSSFFISLHTQIKLALSINLEMNQPETVERHGINNIGNYTE